MAERQAQHRVHAAANATERGRRAFIAGGAAGLASVATGAGVAIADTREPETWPWEHEPQRRFDGKVVLITGATSGIGEATARAFAGEGAQVCFCGRRADRGRQVEQSIRDEGGDVRFVQADVREDDQVQRFVEQCVEIYDGLDIAFNNAGIEGPQGDLATIDLDGDGHYLDVMGTNTHGVMYAMRHELPVMKQGGGGVIINTASMLAHGGAGEWGAYSASKHAVIGLTRSAAQQHAGDNLRILSISPGAVNTALLQRMYGDLSRMAAQSPTGRIGEPEDIAAAVLNFAAPESAYLNGVDVQVNGASAA